MLETRSDITLSGTSYIEKAVAGAETKMRTDVVYLTATINSGSISYSVNKTIQDKDTYLKNKESCDKDIAEFEATVMLSLIHI